MKRFFALVLSISVVFVAADLHAQDKKLIPITRYPAKKVKDTSSKAETDTTEQKDFNDVLQSIFTKNYKPAKNDTIGSKPIISFVPAVGYSLQTKTAATFTGNIVFRSTPNSRISAITTSMGFTQRRQFTLPIVSNIWAFDNSWLFVGDTRFYVYPQSTYGLGSNSDIAGEQPMRYNFLRVSEIAFKRVWGNFFLGVGYKLQKHWNISHEEPLNGGTSDYERYENDVSTASSGFSLNALFDSRDISVNASKGFYGAIEYYNYTTALGSNSNWQSIVVDLRKYYKFPEGSDNVIAFWSYDWLVLRGRPPYLDLPSTSWDTYSTTGRGYIQSRFRGAQMLYLETEYRFKITTNGLIGGVVFLNGQTLSSTPGSKLEKIQPGYGPGLRIKLSKASKTNLDIDYGFGRQGSNGLFLTVGEVF
ncbi:BamA/TamA family outer membrane protein [Mucilaginibacter ginsenosidivorans]|uniref:BamA/TamA family outer membrane protein n=1 Tax=Mucilaginibacter ginsenosidivorans TaxID=398053 RepID=A0A5B8UY83_9SPHI|nr:hypothetical protein [Mucilaginibacter ginsenosidivorans]QEC63356.1 hypothetical protein FRZ54_12475 [Mucilaginibacter ginsenosidivorans]